LSFLARDYGERQDSYSGGQALILGYKFSKVINRLARVDGRLDRLDIGQSGAISSSLSVLLESADFVSEKNAFWVVPVSERLLGVFLILTL
jgi:hypothetical protein